MVRSLETSDSLWCPKPVSVSRNSILVIYCHNNEAHCLITKGSQDRNICEIEWEKSSARVVCSVVTSNSVAASVRVTSINQSLRQAIRTYWNDELVWEEEARDLWEHRPPCPREKKASRFLRVGMGLEAVMLVIRWFLLPPKPNLTCPQISRAENRQNSRYEFGEFGVASF